MWEHIGRYGRVYSIVIDTKSPRAKHDSRAAYQHRLSCTTPLVRHSKVAERMSSTGQSRRFAFAGRMSVLTPIATEIAICALGLVPTDDICGAANCALFDYLVSASEQQRWNPLGRFPLKKLVTFYHFKDINQAIEDSLNRKCVKPILRF